ncbi:protein PERCC1 [Tiliqua scincoides]|uniref:protein PERCC1 n=1 Tax=Tiliqua scincoides TaxID=71010 RepID=UPI003462932D
MAAGGVIQSLGKFQLPMVFQHSFLPPTGGQEMLYQDLSEEEGMEEEDEEEEEREGREVGDTSAGHSPARGEQASPTDASPSEAETTLRLLQFAERISDDIQRYFGRKSKEENTDSCNIYEDIRSPPLSGRVLYYTDLVRISQSGELEEEDDISDPLKPLVQPDQQLGHPLCSKEGADKLGPLAELFEYGLCRYLKEQAPPDSRKLRLERKYAHVTPMHVRKLPLSFWKEPSPSPMCALNSNPPDFSDLLANWTSETGQEELNTSRELTSEMNRQVVDTDHFVGL